VPLNTVQFFLRDTLDGLVLPLGLGNLAAFISPPNPGDGMVPAVYVWGSNGSESRLTVPRAQHLNVASGGDKTLVHQADVWLVWFGSSEDPDVNAQFPAIIDRVMGALRNTRLVDGAQYVTDPVTGQLSQLLDVGEDMSWEYAPVKAIVDQRYLRYDARVTVTVTEVIQS
jgi:hypothetical protein